jgi:hypothetical protein
MLVKAVLAETKRQIIRENQHAIALSLEQPGIVS